MSPLPVKIPMLLSSPVIAKMHEREMYPSNLTVLYPISWHFLIPCTMFLKQQAEDFLHGPTAGSGLLSGDPKPCAKGPSW